MADAAFRWIEEGRPLTVGMLEELQTLLVRRTTSENASACSVRNQQVIIGRRSGAAPDDLPVRAARFVPSPPGLDLRGSLQSLLDWMQDKHIVRELDPVVAAALAHYQFETLHPFIDGNGRIGRLLIVVHLVVQGVLLEPTLTVSPYFEARREEYHDRLLAVSTDADWDTYVRFFAGGLEFSARTTHERMLALIDAHVELKERVRASRLRADTAQALVDYAVSRVSFTVRNVERDLDVSYGRANTLVGQLIELGVLAPVPGTGQVNRRFYAPPVFEILTGEPRARSTT